MTPSEFLDVLLNLFGREENDGVFLSFVDGLGNPAVHEDEDSRYLVYSDLGLSLHFSHSRLRSVFFYSDGYEGHRQYRGPFVCDIRFGDNVESVNEKIGSVQVASGGGHYSSVLKKYVPFWAKWEISAAFLHMQFNSDKGVELITLYRDI